MRYAGIKKVDIANGSGCRVSLYVQGCERHCKGCFNPETWDYTKGEEYTLETQLEVLRALDKSYIHGLSILGGEPLKQDFNLLKLLQIVKYNFPTKTIWLYTGYKFEELTDTQLELLKYVDVLVDGEFIENEKVLDLRFRGSLNQRIIDVKETFKKHRVVLWEDKSGYY